MTDILDLDGWNVIEKRRTGAEYEIEAEYTVIHWSSSRQDKGL